MNDAKFFDALRAGRELGPTLSPSEVSGVSAIVAAMAGSPIAYAAYALATAYKETAHTMQPVEEANWLSQEAANKYFFRQYDIGGNRPALARDELGNIQPGDGIKFHGRGLVQITGRKNYTKAAAALEVDLVGHPELALGAVVAAKIMRRGMAEGWFTTKSFASYLPVTGLAVIPQFIAARRIINGQDCAGEIADAAMHFQAALVAGGWS